VGCLRCVVCLTLSTRRSNHRDELHPENTNPILDEFIEFNKVGIAWRGACPRNHVLPLFAGTQPHLRLCIANPRRRRRR
jgi:hypothetical protein